MIARLLISSSREKKAEEINKILSSHKKHPDLLYFSKDSKLGIEQARKIKRHFSLKPYSDKGPVVVLEDASNLTVEAQNALLKTLEELPSEALFILGADSDAKFLPTILSRCQIVHVDPTSHRNPTSEVGFKQDQDIEKLLESSPAERFEYIEKLKDQEEFLKSMLHHFHKNLSSHIEHVFIAQGDGNTDFIQKLLQAEEWTEQNVNTRAILEYLMLVMPHKL